MLLYLLLYQAREVWAQDFEFICLAWVELRGFEPLTSCMPSPSSVTGTVHDVLFLFDDGMSGPGWFGMVATEASYRPGRARTWPSLRLPPDESLSRLAGQVCACASKRRAAGAPLPAILQGFRIGRRRDGRSCSSAHHR